MSNLFYNHNDGVPPAQSRGTSQLIRNEFDLIQAGFDLLGQNFAGFSGAVFVSGTDGGSVNAYTVTPSTAITAYGTKMLVVFAPTITNTDAVTLNISGLGAKAVNSISGAALVSGDLVAGSYYLAIYTGTEFRLTAITKNYADQLAFNSALPAQTGRSILVTNGSIASWAADQTGNSGKFLSTDGSNISWKVVHAPVGSILYLANNYGGM